MKQLLEYYKKEFKNFLKELKNKKTRVKQIPNLLTISRLFAPLIIIPLFILNYNYIALIVTIIFAITDLFDGFIARKYDAFSEFGRELDPICDKVFIGGIIIALTFKNNLLIIPLILELILSIMTILHKKNNGKPKTLYIGKVKTTCLYVLVAYVFLTLFIKLNDLIFISIYMITLLIQIMATCFYAINYYKESSKKNEKVQRKKTRV